MSAFTEYQLENGQVEVYASTNKYMRFAIEVMDAGYTPIIRSHAHLTLWYDNLLPIELKDKRYLPAEKMMRDWINLFFSNKSRGGLIPTLAQQSGRRYYNPNTGEWVHLPGDTRLFGVLEGYYTSRVSMLGRMHEFLAWFPEDPELANNYREWADAFMQANQDDNWYGHRVFRNSWVLYNFVHTGPPDGTPANPAEWVAQSLHERPDGVPANPDEWVAWVAQSLPEWFEMQFRFALEGFPDSWWVMVCEYGAVALAFVHLSQVSGDDGQYKEFAASINNGLWNARINQSTYLMPSTVTRMGPLPGDHNPEIGKYLADTDCLYWAMNLFRAYGLVGETQLDLQPPWMQNVICNLIGAIFGRQAALRCQTRRRLERLGGLLGGDFPDKYLGMALGLTLDWIRYGWVPVWRQFVGKISYDGIRGDTRLYGDSKYNVLGILIEAYRFTHDDFYLNIFDQAWGQFEEFAADPRLGRFFPELVGHLPCS